jgi:hypothetical protein
MLMNFNSVDPTILTGIRRYETGPRPDAIPINTPTRTAKLEDFDAETQASLRRLEQSLRDDPNWTGTTFQRRAFSDSEIIEAIGRADMTTMDDDQLEAQIEVFNFVFQSGRMEDFVMIGKNGDKTTKSMEEYLSWLGHRREEMKDDGTYSPAIASTW